MKKYFVLTLVIYCLAGPVKAQEINDAFTISKALPDLWQIDQLDRAVESSLKLFELDPTLLAYNIHTAFPLQIKKDSTSFPLAYLSRLYKNDNPELKEMIEGIYWWTVCLKNPKKSSEVFKGIYKLLSQPSSFHSKNSRYILLILQNLARRRAIRFDTFNKLLVKHIQRIREYTFIDSPSTVNEASARAWHRYVLAASYYLQYTSNQRQDWKSLRNAAYYSPDQSDFIEHRQFSLDAILITDNSRIKSFKIHYYDYLVKEGNKKEALKQISSLALEVPSSQNMELLRNQYWNSNPKKPFEQYWYEFINENSKEVSKDGLALLDTINGGGFLKDGRWLFLDVWGTWCGPCVYEMPKIQEYYTKWSKSAADRLDFMTFSFQSTNLDKFMVKNEYSFPVLEVGRSVIQAFDIYHYPTKLLISPEGKYLQLPRSEDLDLFIKSYLLIKN